MTEPRVLRVGPTAIFVDKPSGMLVHNSAFAGARERSLRQVVGTALGRRVFPVHRVDRGTSGIVLLAHERAHVPAWQQALSAPDSVKIYLAICRGRLATDRDIRRPVRGADGVARPARSIFVPVATSDDVRCSLVAIRILTGRHHQARRHAASISHPLVNDATHGNSRFNREFRAVVPLDRLALHAWRLGVRDPFSEERLELTCAPSGPLADAIERLFPALTDDGPASAAARLADVHPDPVSTDRADDLDDDDG